MRVWIVYLEDEPGFIGVFDVEDDAYEFQREYAATSGRAVLLTPVTTPYRASDYAFRTTLHEGPAEHN
jgi:hypothetical protein